jgi:hypothetical protein
MNLPPLPESGGVYRYPDGCAIWPSHNVRGRWLAKWANGATLTGDNDETYYFKSVEEAAQALAEGGEGPAAKPPRATRTVTVYDHCTCGRVLHSLREAESGQCARCWFAAMSPEKRKDLNRLVAAAFDGSTDAQKEAAVREAAKHYGTKETK